MGEGWGALEGEGQCPEHLGCVGEAGWGGICTRGAAEGLGCAGLLPWLCGDGVSSPASDTTLK